MQLTIELIQFKKCPKEWIKNLYKHIYRDNALLTINILPDLLLIIA